MSNNLGRFVVFVGIFIGGSFFAAPSTPFKLITVLYNETVRARAGEYIACMERNLNHSAIDTIHVLYDTSKDDDTNRILNYLKSKNITIDYVEGRPTFGTLFELANQCYPNCRVIISNADIYFNKTLRALDEYDFTNKFLALTRWDVINNRGSLQLFRPRNRHDRIIRTGVVQSQDTWIFSTPIQKFQNEDMRLGTMGCDTFLAYQVQLSDMQLINPCLTIQCCHMHLSKHRNYNPKEKIQVPRDYKSLSYSTLNPFE